MDSYGTKNEEKNNLLWPDCEILNQLSPSLFNNLLFHFPIVKKQTEFKKNNMSPVISRNPISQCGFISPKEFNHYNTLLKLPEAIQFRISVAIKNGMNRSEFNEHV